MSGNSVFGSAISGLAAFQRALQTTSHNIANSATEGYSRQRVELATRIPSGNIQTVGTGVKISGVHRMHDAVVESRMNTYNAGSNYERAMYEYSLQLDELFANPSANLGASLQNFFGAVQGVADTPNSIPAREVMVAEGNNLIDRFEMFASQFESYRDQINNNIEGSIGDLMGYAEAVADINKEIVVSGKANTSTPPNDLLDTRDRLIKEMSNIVNVTTNTNDDGTMDVFIGKGQPLVLHFTTNHIDTVPGEYNPRQLEIVIDNGTGTAVNITKAINGGEVGGLLRMRNEVLTDAENTIGKIAMGVAMEFNAQHRLGMDMEGDINGDFFVEPVSHVFGSSNNTGTGVVSAYVTDPSQLTSSDYELTFDGVDFSLRDTVTNVRTLIPGDPVVTTFPLDTGLGFTLDLDNVTVPSIFNAGDSFLIRPTGVAASSIGMFATEAKDVAAAAAMRMESDWQNSGDVELSGLSVVDITDPNLLNQVTIEFTSATEMTIYDHTTPTPIGTLVPYTSGSPISYYGWEVTLTGTPEIGDVFTIQGNHGATGDNSNMLQLGELQTANTLDNNTQSFQESFSKLVAHVGVVTARADQGRIAQDTLLQQTEEQKSSLSGVNLDEEAADLMRYQQAYAAAARVMATANEIFNSLLDAVR